MKMIFVLGKEKCGACYATTSFLDRKGIAYRYSTITPEEIMEYQQRGFLAAPIVIAGEDTWSGFRIDKLMAL